MRKNKLEHIHTFLYTYTAGSLFTVCMCVCKNGIFEKDENRSKSTKVKNSSEQVEPGEIIKYFHNSINHKCPLDDNVGGMP